MIIIRLSETNCYNLDTARNTDLEPGDGKTYYHPLIANMLDSCNRFLSAIDDYLNKHGYPTKRGGDSRWTHSVVKSVLDRTKIKSA
jgi:hypothetical protein